MRKISRAKKPPPLCVSIVVGLIGLLSFGTTMRAQGHLRVGSANASSGLQRFEVAAIRRAQPGDDFPIIRPTLDGLSVRSCTLGILIEAAYRPPFSLFNYPVIGLPRWANSDRYDIEAKVDGADVARLRKLNRDEQERELYRLLRQLLADRFQLRLHKKPIKLPIYELVLASNGAKIKPGNPAAGFPTGELRVTSGHIQAIGVSMKRFSRALGMEVERDVVDRTGLVGTYSFNLQWQPENRPDASTSWVQPESGLADNLSLSSIFTALREQLGLKLKATRGPGEALVIDQVEKPSPN